MNFIILFFLKISLLLGHTKEVTKDSIAKKDFKELKALFYASETTDAQALVYADQYLNKAKQLHNSKKIIDGYYYKGLVVSDSLKIIYMDSLITLSKTLPDHYFMENALVMKATVFHYTRNYKKALDLYIEAQKYAQKSNNKSMLFSIEHNIGISYNLIGDHKNALKLLKKSLVNFNTLELKNKKIRLRILIGLVTAYRQNNSLDSVSYYNTIGIKETYNESKYIRTYNLFVLKEGINLFFQKNYTNAVDSIKKTIPHFKKEKDDSNLAYAYFYLGKVYAALGNPNNTIKYFKKVDSIFLKINDLFPEARTSYEVLIDHYKKKQNPKKQLVYIERLLRLDSVLHDKQLYLSKRISEDYNTPRLIADKQQIITNLHKKEHLYFLSIIIAFIVIVVVSSLLIYNYVRKKVYKKRFELLLEQQQHNEELISNTLSKNSKKELNIPEDIVDEVLKKIILFKEKNEFLAVDITLQKLAKNLKTNHTYLSKIINVFEDKSFNAFINDLRVDYTIKRLQDDSIFRKYTIDAIAKESGFSNTRTFTRAFQRKTNLKPSFFIKNIHEKLTK